ncbi:hypothetical protein LCGC14_0981270 [marine sediment metagenome]|uniref:Uncharacterized protein n=1 Tax=marine sediment metagenome TaxID=412755 RepID=A0A0F9ND36_9ZZZZ
MVEKIERPKLPPPVKIGGKIVVKVSGRLKQTSTDPRVVVERVD